MGCTVFMYLKVVQMKFIAIMIIANRKHVIHMAMNVMIKSMFWCMQWKRAKKDESWWIKAVNIHHLYVFSTLVNTLLINLK